MVVKKVSGVNINVENDNASFLSTRSRVNDSTLYSDFKGNVKIDVNNLKVYDFINDNNSIKLCFEDKELENVFKFMNEKIMFLEDKIEIIDRELVNRNKDFIDVTARLAKLIYKVYRLKGFWSRLKFLFTGTKGWQDEFKELNT